MTNLANATHTPTRSGPPGALLLVGTVGTGAGLLGAMHAMLLVAYPAAVTENSYSFPFRPGGFAVSQGVLTVRDLALALLLAGLYWTPVARRRVARVGLAGAVVSMGALAALELVSVAVGDSVDPGAWYGFASIGLGLSLTLAGISAARTPMPSRWLRTLPLTIGLYVFVVLTPGILVGFTPGQLVIGVWMLLFACLGRAMLTSWGSAHRSIFSLRSAR